MSLILTAVGVASGLAVGRWLQRRRDARSPTPADIVADAKVPPENALDWDRFVCKLGDVVVHPDGGEAWLAGALVFHEDAPAAVLFVAPEAKADRAVFVRAKPSTDLLWLAPIDTDALALKATEPPTAIELWGEAYERVRRLPVRVRREGEGTPDLGETAIVAEYKSIRSEEKRVISISGGGHARAWSGTRLDVSACDVLPGGATTDR
ncbi:MAG TPA: hypothetical protein VF407_13485 [Polyangiaceae bacterium]